MVAEVIIIIIITSIRLVWYKCKSTAAPRYNTCGVKTHGRAKNEKKNKQKNDKTKSRLSSSHESTLS